jgi:hypothetical protein
MQRILKVGRSNFKVGIYHMVAQLLAVCLWYTRSRLLQGERQKEIRTENENTRKYKGINK